MTLKAGVRISLRAGLFLFTMGAFASEHISLQLVPLRRCGDPFLPDVPHVDRLPAVVTEGNLFEKKGRVPVLVVERHVVPLADGREGYFTLPPRLVIGPYVWWLGAQYLDILLPRDPHP